MKINKPILIILLIAALVSIGVIIFLYSSQKSAQQAQLIETDIPQTETDTYLRAEFEQTALPLDAQLFNQDEQKN